MRAQSGFPLKMERRFLWQGLLAIGVGAATVGATGAIAVESLGHANLEFRSLLSQLVNNPIARQEASGQGEYLTFLASAGEERAPLRGALSQTPISQRASDLIVSCEVSSSKMYIRRYQRPIWPKGLSGVTIGVGYDIGYTGQQELASDWRGYVEQSDLDLLSTACGVKGDQAKEMLRRVQSVVVPWDVAERQFLQRVEPRYVGEVERALKNTTELRPDSLGALVSLVYNRGPSFAIRPDKDSSGRYTEMRNIGQLMERREFARIPAEIRAMKRLWVGKSDMKGLLIRRELEARLFEIGLGQS